MVISLGPRVFSNDYNPPSSHRSVLLVLWSLDLDLVCGLSNKYEFAAGSFVYTNIPRVQLQRLKARLMLLRRTHGRLMLGFWNCYRVICKGLA